MSRRSSRRAPSTQSSPRRSRARPARAPTTRSTATRSAQRARQERRICRWKRRTRRRWPKASPADVSTARLRADVSVGGQVLLDVDAVATAYGTDPPVFQDVSFVLHSGERVAVLGPNGG